VFCGVPCGWSWSLCSFCSFESLSLNSVIDKCLCVCCCCCCCDDDDDDDCDVNANAESLLSVDVDAEFEVFDIFESVSSSSLKIDRICCCFDCWLRLLVMLADLRLTCVVSFEFEFEFEEWKLGLEIVAAVAWLFAEIFVRLQDFNGWWWFDALLLLLLCLLFIDAMSECDVVSVAVLINCRISCLLSCLENDAPFPIFQLKRSCKSLFLYEWYEK